MQNIPIKPFHKRQGLLFLLFLYFLTIGMTKNDIVLVKGGSFIMGDLFGDSGFAVSDEIPIHSVLVSNFYMSKYEVTVGEFREFIRETGYVTYGERKGGGTAINTNTGVWDFVSNASWKNPGYKQSEMIRLYW